MKNLITNEYKKIKFGIAIIVQIISFIYLWNLKDYNQAMAKEIKNQQFFIQVYKVISKPKSLEYLIAGIVLCGIMIAISIIVDLSFYKEEEMKCILCTTLNLALTAMTLNQISKPILISFIAFLIISAIVMYAMNKN